MDPMKMNLSIAQLLLTLYGSVRAADGLPLSEEDGTTYMYGTKSTETRKGCYTVKNYLCTNPTSKGVV